MSRCVKRWVSPAMLWPLLGALAGCAGAPAAGGDGKIKGDENGGKIADALGPAQAQSMNLVTSYCARYDKKGFVTRMDYDGNTITFECRKQTR